MLQGIVERTYWRWMRFTSLAARVDGVDLVYISDSAGVGASTVRAALEAALTHIRWAKGGFGEIVTSHLRFVAALNSGRSMVVNYARGYVSSFGRHELESPHLLACNLVWAATNVRLTWDALAHRRVPERERIREAASVARLRLVRQWPDSEQWEQYLVD